MTVLSATIVCECILSKMNNEIMYYAAVILFKKVGSLSMLPLVILKRTNYKFHDLIILKLHTNTKWITIIRFNSCFR